jgi:hypothetical protein
MKTSMIVEANEAWSLRSYKGQRHDLPRKPRKRVGHASKRGFSSEQVPVLVVRDRSGAPPPMRSCQRDDHIVIETVLELLLSQDAVLRTGGGGKFPPPLYGPERWE